MGAVAANVVRLIVVSLIHADSADVTLFVIQLQESYVAVTTSCSVTEYKQTMSKDEKRFTV